MGRKEGQKTITFENAILIGCVVFAAGFLAGIVFSAFRSAPAVTTQDQASGEKMSQQLAATIMQLQQEINKNPKNASAWISLGNIWFDSNSNEEAIEAYSKALEITPDNANVLTDLGIMYRRTKQFDKALETFQKAAAFDPSHRFARLNQGIVLLYDLGKKNEAIKVWEELLAMAPDMRLSGGVLLSDHLKKVKQDDAEK